jgi:hypothetical protein
VATYANLARRVLGRHGDRVDKEEVSATEWLQVLHGQASPVARLPRGKREHARLRRLVPSSKDEYCVVCSRNAADVAPRDGQLDGHASPIPIHVAFCHLKHLYCVSQVRLATLISDPLPLVRGNRVYLTLRRQPTVNVAARHQNCVVLTVK